MHPNVAVVETLYAALARRDGAAMAACYAPDATFSDPVFDLSGSEIGAMWTMLCTRGRDLAVAWRDVTADDTQGHAAWDARYTFAATGRPVHNRIESTFAFAGGHIVRQVDVFDFHRWARMALGWKARVPGATPLLRGAVRKQARRALDGFIAGSPPGRAPAAPGAR